jgi:hypothetical protein
VSNFPPVVLLTADPELAGLAKAAVWEAGAPVQHLSWPEQLDGLAGAPRLLLRGHDVGAEVEAAVRRIWPKCSTLGLALGAAGGALPQGDLVLPGSWRQLTHLVEAAGAPARTSWRIALIGAHGGAGASCLAVALARGLSSSGVSRLAVLGAAGGPVDSLLGVESRAGWAQAAAAAEAGAAVQPQLAGGIELVGAKGPEPGLAAWQIRRAIEAWEAQADGGVTVLDADRAAPCGGWRCASWADGIVLVGRCDPAGVAAVAALARDLAPAGAPAHLALREVRGGLRLAQAAEALGREDVIKVGDERSLVAALSHGLAPGDRSFGPLAAAAAELAKRVGPPRQAGAPQRPAAGARWPFGARAGRPAPAPAAPSSLQAAFARPRADLDLAGQAASLASARASADEPASARLGRAPRAPRAPRVARAPRVPRADGPRRGRRAGRVTLPTFNPAAFAEEW